MKYICSGLGWLRSRFSGSPSQADLNYLQLKSVLHAQCHADEDENAEV